MLRVFLIPILAFPLPSESVKDNDHLVVAATFEDNSFFQRQVFGIALAKILISCSKPVLNALSNFRVV